MKVYFFLCLGVVGSFAHSVAQKLEMHRGFGNTHFEYIKDDSVFSVSPKQVLEIMTDDPLAYQEFKKARSNSSVAGVLGFTGAVLIVFPIGSAIAGGEPEWGLAAGGVALMLASIPFTKAFKRHAQGAVDNYNKAHSTRKPQAGYFFAGALGGH